MEMDLNRGSSFFMVEVARVSGMNGRRMTVVYAPYGVENPFWAAKGWGKVARRFLYFRHHDDFGEVHKFKLEEVLVFDDWRDDVVEAVEEFKKEKREWEEERERFKRDLELRLARLMREAVEQWEKDNPRPTFKIPELRRPWQEVLAGP